MAFEKGFEVLEVVRKYLSTPYVIPIITGDINLYNSIVCEHFSRMMRNKDCIDSINNRHVAK